MEYRSHADFQYPDLGSFDCNAGTSCAYSSCNAFSILTSDRLTATMPAMTACSRGATFSILTSDRLTATCGLHRGAAGHALSVS